MPLGAVKQFNGKALEWGLRQSYFVEPYKVTGLLGDIYQIINAFPIRGTPHPLGAAVDNAVLERVRLVQWLNKGTALVALVYRRELTGYSGGPRAASAAFRFRTLIALPIWRRFTIEGIVGWTEETRVTVPRAVAIRVETRFIGGNQVAQVQNAIDLNVGNFYTIDGRLYSLSDQSSADYDGRTYTRANYRFERAQALPAIPSGADYGNDVDIPALPAHHHWVGRPDPSLSSPPPIIRAVPPLGVNGSALPGFP